MNIEEDIKELKRRNNVLIDHLIAIHTKLDFIEYEIKSIKIISSGLGFLCIAVSFISFFCGGMYIYDYYR